MAMLRDSCREYADTYPNAPTPDLLLTGPSGLGKTFLMHAMAKRLLDRGLNVLMLSAYRFLDLAARPTFPMTAGKWTP
jgi:DNA replication protein DnaC